MKKLTEKFRKNPYLWTVIILVLSLGIFFRTYKYHDLLRFNADQGRDAELVAGVLQGKQAWPLLGPKAGGTTFKLGPVFYYFQITAAKIFGDSPDKMAYPDLFAGIMAIPLLYLFLRKYFDVRIALCLSSIFALSQFAIRWARFAWNPNSAPFWTVLILYVLHEIIVKKENHKYLWAVVAGVAIGISMQLHTLLMLNLPLTVTIIFGFLAYKKEKVWKYYFIIVALALLVNVPQFYNEYLTKGENIQAFFLGTQKKESSQGSIVANFMQGNNAVFQIVPNILTGYEIADDFKLNTDNTKDLLVVVLGAIFTLSGIYLAFKSFQSEEDETKKRFLLLIAIYTIIAYVFYLKLAFEISVRMYLVVFFVPYFLLGFWLKFLAKKYQKNWLAVFLLVWIFFAGVNLYFVKKYFEEFNGYASANGSVNISTLGELEKYASFISAHTTNGEKVYISGDKKFFFINYLPMRYLVAKSGGELLQVGSKETLSLNKYFYLARENKIKPLKKDQSVNIAGEKSYGKFTILLIEKK